MAGRRQRRIRLAACLLLLGLAGQGGCDAPERSLKRPNLVRRGGDGRLYVSDFHHQRIVVFGPDGRHEGEFGEQGLGAGQLWQVWGMLAEGADQLFVINQRIVAPGSQSTRWEVKQFDQGQERAVHPLSLPGEPDGAGWPAGLTRVPDGGFRVLDGERRAILLFDAAWRYQGRWNGPAGGEPFHSPTCIRKRDNQLWIVDQFANRIRRLSLEGRELGSFGSPGHAPGQLHFPFALDVCPGKWLAVADMGNYRVQRFDLEGNYLDGFEPQASGPRAPVQLLDVLVSPDCARLFLVDSKGNRVLITTPRGQVLQVLDRW